MNRSRQHENGGALVMALMLVVVVGMWTTYPARPIDGVIGSGYLPYGRERDRPLQNLVSRKVIAKHLKDRGIAVTDEESKIHHRQIEILVAYHQMATLFC